MSGKIPLTDWPVAPPVLSASMAAFARADLDALMPGFAQDAVVIDDGRELTGHADVRARLGRVLGAYERTIEVRGVSAVGERDGIHRYDVFAHLEGTFPGGTVDLTFQFGLRDGRVVSLLIVPTEEVTT